MKRVQSILPYLKNKYVITVLVFFIWLLFFDNNDLIRQYNREQQLQELKEERNFYKERIEETRAELKALTSDPEKLERFARERYLMKKKNEEIFVIVDEDEEKVGSEKLLEKN